MTLSKIIILILLTIQVKAQSAQQIFWAMNKVKAVVTNDSAMFVTKVINNGGSLTSTEKTAIGTLIKQLKDSSLWTLFIAIYPMVGGNAAGCKVNMKDTLHFNLTFNASPTFSANGVDWNGSSQYAQTGIIPSATLSQNSTEMSYYSRENTAGGIDIGVNNSGTDRCYFGITGGAIAINTSSSADSYVGTDTRGLFTASRTTSTLTTAYRNGASVFSTATASTGRPTVEMFIGARNNAGPAANFSDRQCAFFAVGTGLTAAQAATLYNIVQAFETTLARQV